MSYKSEKTGGTKGKDPKTPTSSGSKSFKGVMDSRPSNSDRRQTRK